jgi:hypothetical protein
MRSRQLWLETHLPDEEARAEILREHVALPPPALQVVDVQALAAAREISPQ